jgi:Flp pilus assembly protein TadG
MNTTINDRKRGERGSQIAELALVLPLLAFLALVVSEGAGVVRTHQVINNAAREGARISAEQVSQDAISAIQTAVADYACFNGVKLSGASTSACTRTTFNVTCASAGSAVTVNQKVLVPTAAGVGIQSSQVTVTCNYPLTYLPKLSFPSLGISVSNSIPLRATATFSNFYGGN